MSTPHGRPPLFVSERRSSTLVEEVINYRMTSARCRCSRWSRAHAGHASDLLPDLICSGQVDTSPAVRDTSAPTDPGLRGSSNGSGLRRGHRAAGSHHQHQRVIKSVSIDAF